MTISKESWKNILSYLQTRDVKNLESVDKFRHSCVNATKQWLHKSVFNRQNDIFDIMKCHSKTLRTIHFKNINYSYIPDNVYEGVTTIIFENSGFAHSMWAHLMDNLWYRFKNLTKLVIKGKCNVNLSYLFLCKKLEIIHIEGSNKSFKFPTNVLGCDNLKYVYINIPTDRRYVNVVSPALECFSVSSDFNKIIKHSNNLKFLNTSNNINGDSEIGTIYDFMVMKYIHEI